MRPIIIPALFLCLCAVVTHAQDPAHATEFRKPTPGPGPNGVMQPVFLSHRLGNDHAEGITTLDMNNDGFPDIVSGAYWYENPGAKGGDWKQHQYRTVGTHNEFVSDCGEWTVDVNHDGAPDVVTTGWISNGLWWYENPGKATSATAMWQKHFITDSYDTEGGAFADINGDGKPDIALAHYNHSGIIWVDFSSPTPRVHHVGGKDQDGHGIGIGDVDGDGKADILTPYGWFRNIDADNDKWEWHPDWHLGDAGFPILAYDVNNDGKVDIIYGQGHSYGLYWLEQSGSPDHRIWTRRTIDESFSQSHALKLVDLDGDGEPYLITGKRYRGHSGDDPGSYDPIVLYAYKINRKTGTFTRTAISVNGTASAGTQIIAEDLDKDGDIDLATAGKLGVHFLENLKINNVPKATREAQQPLERKWPFPGEGQDVPQEDGPKN
jgi:FG-GAP-like repeat